MDSTTSIQINEFTHTGWAEINGKAGFLSGSGFLSADGLDESIKVNLTGANLHPYALPHPPSGEALQTAVRASIGFLERGPHELTNPLWAAMWAAVFTGIDPLRVVLWVYGPPQSQKSTITSLALAHFRKNFVDEWPGLASYTSAALENLTSSAKDIPLVIDLLSNEMAERHRVQRLIRHVCNRSARTVLRNDLSVWQSNPPRGLVIVTADYPPGEEALRKRTIRISTTSEKTFPAFDIEANLYGQAMAAFLQWMAADRKRADTAFQNFVIDAEDYARQWISTETMQWLWMNSFAILHAAQHTALLAFVELGAISSQEAANVLLKNRDALVDLMNKQEVTEYP